MNKVCLLWGLPGSGKSTYAEEKRSIRGFFGLSVVDVDRLATKCKGEKLFECIAEEVANRSSYGGDTLIIIDGLITTNSIAIKLFDAIYSKCKKQFGFEFSIVWWQKDVESCLHNDLGRRDKTSKISIENLPFEEPCSKVLNKYVGDRITMKTVVRKTKFQTWLEKYDLSPEIKSGSWSLGGTWANCWGNSGTVEADAPLDNFEEFDELLSKICPDISFLNYKRLYSASVGVDTKGESDYYGGSTTYAYRKCNLQELYNKLLEMNLIKEEE